MLQWSLIFAIFAPNKKSYNNASEIGLLRPGLGFCSLKPMAWIKELTFAVVFNKALHIIYIL